MLATVGVYIKVNANFPTRLDQLRQWDGQALSAPLRARVAHEWEKVALFTTHIDASNRAGVNCASGRCGGALVRQLLQLRGIGEQSAWVFVTELFAWRRFRNRREVGGSRDGGDAVSEQPSQS